MECEARLKDELKSILNDYYEVYHETFIDYTSPDFNNATISKLLDIKNALLSSRNAIAETQLDDLAIDVKEIIRGIYETDLQQYEEAKTDLEIKHNLQVGGLKARHLKEEEARIAKDKEEMQPIVDKHNELMSYKEAFTDIVNRYDIDVNSVEFNKDITLEDLTDLIDSSLFVCKNICKIKKSFVDYLMVPFNQGVWEFSVMMTIAYIVVWWLFKGLLTLPVFIYFGYKILSMHKDEERIKLAASVMCNIDFDSYITQVCDEVDTSEFDKAYEEGLQELEASNIQDNLDADLNESAAYTIKFTENLANMKHGLETEKQDNLKVIDNYIKLIDDKLDDYKKNHKRFGSFVFSSEVLSNKFVLGLRDDIIEEVVELGLDNFVFDSSRGEEMFDFLKLCMWNMEFNVKEKHLYLDIIDPEDMGLNVSGFLDKHLSEYNKVHVKNFEKLFTEKRDIAKSLISELKKTSVPDFNAVAYEKGILCKDYHLIVVCSGVKNVLELNNIIDFLRYSSKYGIYVWFYHDTPIENTKFINEIGFGVQYPLDVNEYESEYIKTLVYAFENSTVSGLDYVNSYIDRVVPEDKKWTYSTINGIELNMGFEDGDPEKPIPLVFNDGNVHALMGGQTGSGKSVAINQALLTLCYKYSPEELNLYAIDLKNVEFHKLTEDGYSIIPHARVLAGTKDGAYMISVFDDLLDEMNRRIEMFGEYKVVHIREYREKSGKKLPRILLLVDEFQQMFTEAPNVVDKIQDKIDALAKLARFCGVHMWFTSQSMSGTLKADTLSQFSLRMALRCQAATSEQLLGNTAAARIKTRFGYCISNDSNGQDANANRLWRVPFCKTEYVISMMKALQEKGIKEGTTVHRCEFYNQSELFSDSKLINFFDAHPDTSDATNRIFLGDRAFYSRNKAPVNFMLGCYINENVLAIAMELTDMLNLVYTFMDNITHKNGSGFMVSCCDRSTWNMLGLDNFLSPEFYELSNPDVNIDTWTDVLMSIVEAREQKDESELKATYVLCVQWEQMVGLCRNNQYKTQAVWQDLIPRANKVHLHFIWICATKTDIPRFFCDMSKHRIACRCREVDSVFFIDSTQAFKLTQSGYGIYSYNGDNMTFKLYQHEFKGKIEEKEAFYD